jgi:hypothetical protein
LKTVESSFEILNPVPDEVRFVHVDLMIQAGDLDRAEHAIEDVNLPVYRHLLEGRLHLERGEPAAAPRRSRRGHSSVAKQCGGAAAGGPCV